VEVPVDVIVVGAGATGVEFAHLFDRLGASVTWIVDDNGILPTFPRAATTLLRDAFVQRGIRIVEGTAERLDADGAGVVLTLRDGERVRARTAFLATGRSAAVHGTNLEATGLRVRPGGAISVDIFCQTGVPGVYAVGDMLGAPMLANRGEAQGRIAGAHAAGAPTVGFRPETVVNAVYSEPQVAMVGEVSGLYSPTPARRIQRVRIPFHAALHSLVHTSAEGWLELFYAEHGGEVVGAWAVGEDAADALSSVALAIGAGASVAAMALVAPAVPTSSELPFLAARRAVSHRPHGF
jgi:dihydrolipoamide dehydrogenase